ncbi:DUF2818 family protein [Xylophilus rhododendri]|uniref:DUF2818 family protein n=1 Tax=Xylophilus rhododendri TaxID=2697032 RepID=A0A857JE06_9BURK|nr:DUF2818 family protein [Xylophilus rhododendri]QHJ01183.1 DUF2818 family protein [Xylophilus rhododendri]
MATHFSVWLVLLVGLLAANLPFVSERLLGVVALKRGDKPGLARIGELVLLYFVAGAVGLFLEDRAGQIAPQGWEFYAVTGALFLTFAFPGFIWRYLLRRKG